MARNTYAVDEELERKFDFSKLKRSLFYVKPHIKPMLCALLISTCASLLSLLLPLMLSKALDEAIPNSDVKMLVHLAIITISVMIFSAVLEAVRGVIMARVGQKMVYNIRMDVFTHLQKLPFSYYDSRPHGKILVRVVNYVNNLSNTLSNGIVNTLISILDIFFIAIYMFLLDTKLAFVICLGIPPLMLVVFLLKNRQKKTLFMFNNKNSNLTAYSCEHIEGVKVSQIFNRQDENMSIYKTLNAIYRKAWYKMCLYINLLTPITEILQQVVVALVYIFGILIFKPSVEVGVLIAMATYASRFWQPIINLANLYNNFLTSISYLERIFQTLDEPIEIKDGENSCDIENMQGIVTFDDVCFEYEKGVPVLKNVSFKINKGESAAFVGQTGSGKTTIVSLISRFYDTTSGEILIDGIPIKDISIKSLRSNVSVMMQDSFIFSGTIADNIRYGRLDATDEEVKSAAKAVCVDEIIMKMENGYNTFVSEKGGQLSQGEKQLISLARTMLSNPSMLILDEATSNIDAKTEFMLKKGINHLLKDRTSFIIAHRLSTIRNCDRIMFVKDGEIVESGTHDELMAKKGLYYELCKTQQEG